MRFFSVLVLLFQMISNVDPLDEDPIGKLADLEYEELTVEQLNLFKLGFWDLFTYSVNTWNNMTANFEQLISGPDIFNGLKCAQEFNVVFEEFKKGENWTLNFFDGWAKPSISLAWIGSEKICKRAKANYTLFSTSHQFQAQLCHLMIHFPQEMMLNASLKLGMCIPDSCTEDFIRNLLIKFNAGLPKWRYMPMFDIQCDFNLSRYIDLPFILMSLFLAVLIVFIILGTILDVIISNYDQEKLQNHMIGNGLSKNNHCAVIQNEYNQIVKRNPTLDDYNQKNKISEEENRTVCIISKKEKQDSFNGEIKSLPPFYGYKHTVFGQVLLCFSIYTNGARLFQLKLENQQLACINGLRVLSMFGVMTAHSYNIVANSDNPINISQMMNFFSFNNLLMASFTMTTFFTMSGILVSYLYFTIRDTGKKVTWFQFYLDRFLRITPTFWFTVLFLWKFVSKVDRGQMDFSLEFIDKICRKNWWLDVFYLQNMLKNAEICDGITWYLATDMQLYWISPIIIILLIKSASLTVIVSVLLIAASWITTTVLTYQNDYQLFLPKHVSVGYMYRMVFGEEWFQGIYTRPWYRLTAYLLGMLCGWALYKTKCSIKLSKTQVFKLWILGISLTVPIMFTLYMFQLSVGMTAVYFVLYGTIWPFGFCIAVFLCCSGYGGIVNSFLSWPGWLPFTRLSFSLYLGHFFVLQYSMINLEKLVHLNFPAITMNLFSMWLTSTGLAACFYFLIEVPALRLKNVFLKKK